MKTHWLAGAVLLVLMLGLAWWLTDQEVHAAPPVPAVVGPPLPALEVDSLTPMLPSSEVRTLQDIAIFDLRAWPAERARSTGSTAVPVAFVNVLRMKKSEDVSHAIAHYATSGTKIDLTCLTLSCTAERAQVGDHTASWTEYAVKADISSIPNGSEFILVVHGTYWDGFRSDSMESAATYLDAAASADTDLRLVVLFPPTKPGRIVRLTRVDDQTSATHTIPVRNLFPSEQAQANWKIENLVPGSHYVMEWEW